MRRALGALGITLMLGGLAHSAGVLLLYSKQGVPDANRVLLDACVAEAQLLAGALFLRARWAFVRCEVWRPWTIAGSTTVLSYALPFLPVLFARAPIVFRIPPLLYSAASIALLVADPRTPTQRESGVSGLP